MANETVFVRHSSNPLIRPEQVKGANSVFNSAVVPFGSGFVGVFRVDTLEWFSELRVGHSADGLNWTIADERLQVAADPARFPTANRVENSPYDPRVTRIEDTYYVTFCHYPTDGAGPAAGLASTTDFEHFTLLQDVLFPFNRNAVLFPRKIGERYAILHRPSDTGHTPFGEIFYATSPDLLHWGDHRLVFGTASAWQSTKVGPGPAPIETSEGWLLLYHGVKTTCSGFIYCAGGAVLDLDEPWNVRWRSKQYLLAPTELYERVGDVPNVIFPTAAHVDPATGMLAMYYGAADTCVAMAEAPLTDLLAFIRDNNG